MKKYLANTLTDRPQKQKKKVQKPAISTNSCFIFSEFFLTEKKLNQHENSVRALLLWLEAQFLIKKMSLWYNIQRRKVKA